MGDEREAPSVSAATPQHFYISRSPNDQNTFLLIGIFMSLLMKVTKISDLSPYFKFFFCFTHFLDMLKIFNLILFPTLTA